MLDRLRALMTPLLAKSVLFWLVALFLGSLVGEEFASGMVAGALGCVLCTVLFWDGPSSATDADIDRIVGR